MDATALRALQAPIKDRYRSDPDTAVITLRAQGSLDEGNLVNLENVVDAQLVEAVLARRGAGDAVVPQRPSQSPSPCAPARQAWQHGQSGDGPHARRSCKSRQHQPTSQWEDA